MKQLIKNTTIAALLLMVAGISSCWEDKNKCKYDDGGAGTNVNDLPPYLANCSSTFFETPPTNVSNGKTFNYTKFQQALFDSLPGVGGVQFAMMQSGFLYMSGATGDARETGECPELSLSPCNKMNIASVSKLLTAACVMNMLYAQGLTEESAIGPFLPPSWNVPALMFNTTFRQMFSHRSGLHQYTSNTDFSNTLSYNGLRTLAKQGPNADSIGTQRYRNANVAMMRIIIPQLWKNLPSCPQALLNAGEITDALSKTYYEAAIRTFVLNPVGADGELDGSDFGDFETLNYPVSGGKGVSAGEWTGLAGGGGWYMTAQDMVRVIDGIFNGVIVSNTIASTMTANNIGFWNYLGVTDGTLTGHGGDISYSAGEWHNVLLYNTSNGISIAVNINTGTKSGGGLYGPVVAAYNAAWE